jgi:hypothetical protein
MTQQLKHSQIKESPNYDKGTELLKKAVAREKEASRYYAQYVQWVAKYNVPLSVITLHFMEAKGLTMQSARRSARAVIMLNEPNNKGHLEDLMNGKISFPLAVMLTHVPAVPISVASVIPLGPGARAEAAMNADETAREYLNMAINILKRHHKTWGPRQFLDWVTEVTWPLFRNVLARQAASK